MRTFGKNLERLERIKGRFETDICLHNKIPRSTYRQWKEGSQEIFLQRLVQVANYFGVTVDELLRENPFPYIPSITPAEWRVLLKNLMQIDGK